MTSNLSINSVDTGVFFEEPLSSELSPRRNNSPVILNSTELTGTHTREMSTNSPFASPEPDIVTLDDNSNEPTFQYGFGAQQPIDLPSLKDLNRRPNPFKIQAALTEFLKNLTQHDNKYSPQSP